MPCWFWREFAQQTFEIYIETLALFVIEVFALEEK
jgi:hypothetical protein